MGTSSPLKVSNGKQHFPLKSFLNRILNLPQICKGEQKCETWRRVRSGAVVLYLFPRTLLSRANINGKCCIAFSGEQVAPEGGEWKEHRMGREGKQHSEKCGSLQGSWIPFFTTRSVVPMTSRKANRYRSLAQRKSYWFLDTHTILCIFITCRDWMRKEFQASHSWPACTSWLCTKQEEVSFPHSYTLRRQVNAVF